ncbi:MAG: TetR/AcrR family transcriptional regulator [Clostridia bacterium]|nr:TetR/AcrR family transcriptional regulator [Clostridia bacterium]
MPPRVKFQKDEIVDAAVAVASEKGMEALTAREVAAALAVSTRPIFTWFDTMEELKAAVYDRVMERYREYLERGLAQPIPFFGVWQQYIRFANEQPELYKLLYLTKAGGVSGGATEALRFSQELVRPSIMRIYNMDAATADKYFLHLWLTAFSFATLIVTDDCPYTEEEMLTIGTEVSLAVCKAYKEVPGLAKGEFDKDAIFRELVKK